MDKDKKKSIILEFSFAANSHDIRKQNGRM